jgi:pilus assembly protein CpaE
MSDSVRIVLFNAVGTREMSFRGAFDNIPGMHILAEITDWETLRDKLRDPSVDLLAIGLDDPKELGFEVVQRASQARPNCGIIGISHRHDPTTIIRAMRAGCSQFVCAPIDTQDLKNAIGRIRATREVATHHSKRICVIGSSGGAGATTVACNLAIELAHLTNHRSALVDLNLEFGDVACSFDCSPSFSVADVCREGMQIDSIILGKALHELPCNVSILARPEKLNCAREVTPEGLASMFSVLSSMFPYIVVDLPRACDYISAAALGPADHILIVTQLSVPFLRNATRIHRSLLEMGAAEDRIDIVLNRVKSTFERITPDDVENHFGRPILATIPNDYHSVQSALDFGHPIVADAPETPARLAIQKMARRLVGEIVEAAPQAGLLNRLLGRSEKRPVKV